MKNNDRKIPGKSLVNAAIYLLSLALITACANIQPPSGGPRDTTPPTVTEFFPPQNTLNYKGKTIDVTFSAYPNKNKTIESISIQPTLPLAYDWSGKSLEIEFLEEPKPNVTYALTIDADYADYLNNKAAESFTLVFSTGTEIDSARINGKLLDDSPAGVSIFCYRIDDKNPDTLNPAIHKSDYRVRCGSNGAFSLKALKRGVYRLFAVKDEMKDDLYSPGKDAFGAATFDPVATDSGSVFVTISTGPAIDESPIVLNFAEAIFENTLRLDFGEIPDTASLRPEAFEIADSSGLEKIPVKYAYPAPGEAARVILITEAPLANKKKYYVQVNNDSALCVRDTSGNPISDTLRKTYFIGVSGRDSSKVRLIKKPLADAAQNIPLKRAFDFVFSAPVIIRDSIEPIKLIKAADSTPVKYSISNITANIIRVVPVAELESFVEYVLSFNSKGVKSFAGDGIKDTTFSLKFKTLDNRSGSDISGRAIFDFDTSKSYMIKFISTDKKNTFRVPMGRDGLWKLKNATPGTYRAEAYEDVLKTGEYFYGRPFPYSPSARIIKFKTEIKAPPRWKVENIILTE